MSDESWLTIVQKIVPQATCVEPAVPPTVAVPVTALHNLLRDLTAAPYLFDMLLDHTAIDWIEAKEFELVYTLYSSKTKSLVGLTTRIDRDHAVAPTVSDLFPVAEFQEREVYDLFGVLYEEHPDLRRLFLEDDWVGFPLRKDYRDDFMLEQTP